ncbi:hypothetical protein GCK72_025189 [Caenorhabditis remanei]|uniref:Uncharacterized protein n=2 Tax=Caenorhabditis remanei TaxID=31234 RepID=A0A6A5G226_CAERE|nr:hypothetical protein GCK72_025189 [Caenorhabditis remanei]KAF1748722.1 hypothetical protein GCK72_025189 [Caenorhabditis remanei]
MPPVYCEGEMAELCQHAYCFRGAPTILDSYLLGPIDAYVIAGLIHHNKKFHGRHLVGQMDRLKDMLEEKNTLLHIPYSRKFLSSLRNKILHIEHQMEHREADMERSARKKEEDRGNQVKTLNSKRIEPAEEKKATPKKAKKAKQSKKIN